MARIPLLDFSVLHDEVQRVLPTLPEELRSRNLLGTTRLFVGVRVEDEVKVNRKHEVMRGSGDASHITMLPGSRTIAGTFAPQAMKEVTLVDERFPRIGVPDVLCGEYRAPTIDTSKLSCLLPGTASMKSELPSKGLKIREPHNWMGVSISDLGRGYSWSDYIQLV